MMLSGGDSGNSGNSTSATFLCSAVFGANRHLQAAACRPFASWQQTSPSTC